MKGRVILAAVTSVIFPACTFSPRERREQNAGAIWASNAVGQTGVTKSLTGGEPMSNGVGN